MVKKGGLKQIGALTAISILNFCFLFYRRQPYFGLKTKIFRRTPSLRRIFQNKNFRKTLPLQQSLKTNLTVLIFVRRRSDFTLLVKKFDVPFMFFERKKVTLLASNCLILIRGALVLYCRGRNHFLISWLVS